VDCLTSSLRRLRSLAALDAPERRLALGAVWRLAAVSILLRWVPFARLRAFIERRERIAGREAVSPHSVRRAVSRAERTIPRSSCLARALVGEWLLRSGGQEARLTIGVAAGPGAMLDAHAWVESGGVVVAGDEDIGRYRKLASFEGRSR
jgi:hypothetical protein